MFWFQPPFSNKFKICIDLGLHKSSLDLIQETEHFYPLPSTLSPYRNILHLLFVELKSINEYIISPPREFTCESFTV